MANLIDKHFDALLRRHLPEMKLERKLDPSASVHTPEQHADAVLGRARKAQIPEQHFPVDRPSFNPERRPKRAPVRLVARLHVVLQVMARDEFVLDGCAREMNVVATHRHQLRVLAHRTRRVGDDDERPTEEEGLTSWRSGDIISIRRVSFAIAGTVTRSLLSTNSIASSASCLISSGCCPG